MERTFDTPTPPGLDLRIPVGTIAVDATGDGSTEIRLDGPQELLDKTVVEQRGSTIVVDAESWRGWLSWRGRDLRLSVRCPEGASLGARTKSADVSVHGRLARADVATASGDVLLETIDGATSVKTASGDVSIRDCGGLDVNTASGDVAAGAVRGAVRANLVSGDLRVDDAAESVTVNSVSGDVDLHAVQRGTVRVQLVSGDVEVGVRRGSRVHVDASTLSGDTRSELDLSGDPAAGDGDGPLVELIMKSVSGDLTVVRAPEAQPQEVQQP